MQRHFPPVEATAREWRNLADASGVRSELLSALLAQFIPSESILVEVHRYLGDFLEKPQAIAFIAEHIGKGNIRVSNREFTGFVYVASNGVATGWSGA
jgi:hypothetical protein